MEAYGDTQKWWFGILPTLFAHFIAFQSFDTSFKKILPEYYCFELKLLASLQRSYTEHGHLVDSCTLGEFHAVCTTLILGWYTISNREIPKTPIISVRSSPCKRHALPCCFQIYRNLWLRRAFSGNLCVSGNLSTGTDMNSTRKGS